MEERVIPEYPTYAITNTGLVRDLRTGGLSNGSCILGYRKYNLTNPNKTSHVLIHRLVAQAFIPNPDNLPEVDHINRKSDDNRVENLRWANDYTQSQNRGDMKNNTSGYKHITCEDKYFRVVIVRNKQVLIRKRFQTIEDAVKCRDDFLANHL